MFRMVPFDGSKGPIQKSRDPKMGPKEISIDVTQSELVFAWTGPFGRVKPIHHLGLGPF